MFNVDVRFTELRRGTRQLAGPVCKARLRNVVFRVAEMLANQRFLCVTGSSTTMRTMLFPSKGTDWNARMLTLRSARVFATSSKSSWPVFHANCEFFGRGHVEPPFPLREAQARSLVIRCRFGRNCAFNNVLPDFQVSSSEIVMNSL